jgi:hypothetical protein
MTTQSAILVWRSDEAPEEYKALNTFDFAEWIVFVPDSFGPLPRWMESPPFAPVFSYSRSIPVEGGTVVITSPT